MSDKKHDRTKRVWRRLLVFVLCFCVWFTPYSDMPGWSSAFAQESEAAWCNAENDELSYGTFEQAIESVGDHGTVILRSDVNLTEGMTVSKSIMITSWDANAPCTIKNTVSDSDDRVEYGKIFTVLNCQLILQDIILDGGKEEGAFANRPLICVKNGATVRMQSGTVLQNAENRSQSFCGGGVSIRSGALYMYDGAVIKNCKARHGGGVEVNSENKAPNGAMFGMADGSIENCTADCGGGVYVNIGQFQMLGGKIAGNSATSDYYNEGGGGIYAASPYHKYIAAVRIAGGEISGNTAASGGGGILVCGSYAQLYLEGGTIKNNYASTGGGVSMVLGTMRLYGGTVTENTAENYGGGVLGSPDSVIFMHGAPKVFGNTAGSNEGVFDNLYLDGADDDGYPTSPIRLDGALTDGVNLGMSRWVLPDGEHPYRQMIVPYGGYSFSQSDLDRLCYDRSDENKELYADNMEKYAFIPYNNEIVMVLAADIALDKETLSFKGTSDPSEQIIATVTPANAPENGVMWESSNENAAMVDENGNVLPIGGGKAIITATTKSPYHAKAQCVVTVGHKLSNEAEHGTITFTPVDSEGYFPSGKVITLHTDADEGYQLSSLKAYRTDNDAEEVGISGDTLTMPEHDVTVKAVFEPITYTIGYDLDGGELAADETNPDSYTIESGEITLKNPTKSGYTFAGWTGTGLTEPTLSVTIPSGSTGAREYMAHWGGPVYCLTTKAEHGTLINTSRQMLTEFFAENTVITLQPIADDGYQFLSLKAYLTDNETEEVDISDNTLTMPDHDVTALAMFEPIIYTIGYDLDGGELAADETNPDSYTIESGEITLKNPTKSGCTFAGWTGTGLTEPTLSVTIPLGSTGERVYTALWKAKNDSKPSGGSSGGGGSSHRHRYIYDEAIVKEPTCTESGEKTLSCSCGQTTTETVPALGHDYRGEITKPATETENGIRTFTCTRCGDTYTEIIEKTGSESKPDETSSGMSDNTSDGTSDDNSSGTSTSGDTSSNSGDTSSDNSGSSSDDSGTSSNSGSSSGGTGEDNPITGAAAVIPLMAMIAAAAALAVTKSRKK